MPTVKLGLGAQTGGWCQGALGHSWVAFLLFVPSHSAPAGLAFWLRLLLYPHGKAGGGPQVRSVPVPDSEFYPHSLTPALTGYVTCGKSLHLSGLSFLIYKKEMATTDAAKTVILSTERKDTS